MRTDESELEGRLVVLFQDAQSALTSGASTSDFEPAFVALLQFIKTHSKECLELATDLFLNEVVAGAHDFELVSFCMHELRLHPVKEEAERQLQLSLAERPDLPPPTNVMLHIIASFSDDWDDVDLYEHYTKRS